MTRVAAILMGASMLAGLAAYAAWLNGAFPRCPYCGKIGSWRYDDAGALVKEKDEDGWVLSTTQLRVCRKCKRVVLEKWSDCEGRSFERHPGGTNTEPGAAPESGPATS